MRTRGIAVFFCAAVLSVLLGATGYAQVVDAPAGSAGLGVPPKPVMPVASGVDVRKNEKTSLDVSNAKDGYIMVNYLVKTASAVRVIVITPDNTQYTYALKTNGDYEVFPLSGGSGVYNIGVYENTTGIKYATVLTEKLDVKLANEYAPFLLPNQYANYNQDSETVKKAVELTKNAGNTLEKIEVVFNYVIQHISYDMTFAAAVRSGNVSIYVPDPDTSLQSGKGICLDYAALMTAMLRSQGIPTKIVVGYVKDIYHAWISTYSSETGWVDQVIYFDGKSWKLMDPTFASANEVSEEVMQFISDEKNYKVKLIY